MGRRAAAIVLFGVACLAAGYMARQPNKRANGGYAQASSQAPHASAAAPAGTTTADQAGSRSRSWYAAPEWWLVIIAFPTLWLLWYEARETANAAKATKDAAEATRRSVELQETLNQQWLDIDGWRREGDSSRELNPPHFTIAVDIGNPTSAPLTVKSVSIRIVGNESMEYDVGNVLAPDGEPIKVTYSYTVKPSELVAYTSYALPLVVDGFATFVDCFGKERRQDFMRACFLGPKFFRDSAMVGRQKP